MQFLLFCGAVIRGVHLYGPLLRAVVATASNDHRLGANEAPPAIISIYLGTQLEEVFGQIAKGEIKDSAQVGMMNLGVNTLPVFPKDPGDRNRTSPFAFTGNRFEFRAVGSNQSVSGPLVAMNTILADSLTWVADELESELAKGTQLNTAVRAILKEIIDKHSAVVFGGDGYSEEWHKMAVEERGLLNLRTTADALPFLKEKHVEEIFERLGVLTPVELESRFDVYAEQYIQSIEVEAKLVISMAKTIDFLHKCDNYNKNKSRKLKAAMTYEQVKNLSSEDFKRMYGVTINVFKDMVKTIALRKSTANKKWKTRQIEY